MHNLTTEVDDLARELDTTKAGTLADISKAASKITSLNSRKHPVKTMRSNLAAIAEDTVESIEEMDNEDDDLGVFESDDIQAALRDMNYELSYVPFGVRPVLFLNLNGSVWILGGLTALPNCHRNQQNR